MLKPTGVALDRLAARSECIGYGLWRHMTHHLTEAHRTQLIADLTIKELLLARQAAEVGASLIDCRHHPRRLDAAAVAGLPTTRIGRVRRLYPAAPTAFIDLVAHNPGPEASQCADG